MNDRELLLSLIGSLTLCDNMSDVADDVWTVLRHICMTPPESVGDMHDLGTWLGKMHGVQTLYGTELYDPKDEDDADD